MIAMRFNGVFYSVRTWAAGICLGATATAVLAQNPPYVGLGDSIGEGVQTYDANQNTQPNSYIKIIADKVGAPMPLPLIRSNPIGQVGDLLGRSRIDPYVVSYNLAVSGADVHSLIHDRADAQSPDEFASETDLVQFPKLGSQLEIAEYYHPPFATCWIGNNDVLAAATSFDQLDASQLTPLDEFRADFTEIVTRLNNARIYTIFGNIPDVTSIAFLFGPDDLVRFTGSSHGLAEGDYTSLVAMLLIRLGLDDGSILLDPDWVLDAHEVTLIRERTEAFNQIIAEQTAAVGLTYIDANAIFRAIRENPPVILGLPVETRFTGGLFSLDGVHPSNVGQLLIAQALIAKVNDHLQLNFPNFSDLDLARALLRDPFVDKDGDGRVAGRPGAGLLETAMFLIGISGDFIDFPLRPPTARARPALPPWDSELFKRVWLPSKGLGGTYTDADRAFTIWLFKHAMGQDD